MPLASCERCGKLFSKTNLPICPKCEADEENDYEKVRDALQKSPNLTAEEVSESTGVEISCVLRLIEQGRIQNVPSSGKVLCGRCGAPAISLSKKLCEACLNKLNQELAKEQAKIQLPKKKEVEVGTALNVPDSLKGKSRGLEFRNR